MSEYFVARIKERKKVCLLREKGVEAWLVATFISEEEALLFKEWLEKQISPI